MPYQLVQRTNNRSEFAVIANPDDRFIHQNEKTNRKVGTLNQAIFRNQFSAVKHKDYAPAGSTVTMLLPSSAKLVLSAPNLGEAKSAWDMLKEEVDQTFKDQPLIYAGLPLSPDWNINA